MRVIFMGTPDFSVGTLEALVQAGHEVVLAVTQPDKPKGRGGKMQYTPVKEKALEYGIPVFQPAKVREPACVEELAGYRADVIVVIAFGQILPRSILELTPYGCINVHASLLPKYRGAAPIQWALIDGETVTGVTTMQMDEGLDTGDMLLETEVPIGADETGGSLHDKLAAAGAKLCVETLKALEEGTVTPRKQGESPTKYARMLDKELGRIDWSRDAASIERLIRGLSPWPSAYTLWEGKTMKIWAAEVLDGDSALPCGAVADVTKTGFSVQTGSGLLRILELQIPGKKRMSADAFLRGYRMEPGTRLGGE
ncbi:methionyl-tRNA formyltransferase [Mordavella massiliensis]|uniref:Methionyl-tRNA formyltransferase n=1 Tax=Mordavella massiliensis TaxID=1871024 RepID=A0A939BH64_9CLOT|nr:methionyl-tRNA formyltransferase [Mordavella massiliensis]MBM6948476.1 methionyl-tRNA formyltransferase [Mordavella massiliensis]